MLTALVHRLLSLQGNTPRWVVFAFDTGIVLFSLLLAYSLRFNFRIPAAEIESWRVVIPTVLGVRMISFFAFRTFAGIVRYTSTRDAVRVAAALAAGSALFTALNFLNYYRTGVYLLPFSIVVLEYIISAFLMTGGRIAVKILYSELRIPSREKTKVIIYGAGESGVITKRAIDRDAGTKYKVSAFVDDDPRKAGKRLEGIPIYDARTQLESLLRSRDVRHLIIAIQNIAPARKKELIESCLAYDTKVLNVPPVNTWINGELSFMQIKKIRIEDLLDRDPIQLNTEAIRAELTGKKILITGAAGSIGSEITRQVIPFHPAAVYLLDSAESPLHELGLEVAEMNKQCHAETVIADVTSAERMRNVFRSFRPDLVFHAAAYKHVPMMENNPSESIRTNVLGTKVTADLAHEFKLRKFVLVSTDKAVNPTSVMGATKRIAEIYVQSLNRHSPCSFVTTRFGNVLGSNGSVIPRFRRQIEQRKPVTVTHPDVTRYFMTIPEACQLVLEAGAMGRGGEIYLFDMGRPVKIDDLARKMIQLSGLTLGKDIQITYTGLRPGEKLYEELLATEENTLPTHHPKILVARVKEYDFQHIASEIRELIALFDTQNNEAIVRKMKQIVPEFISRNSVFEKLDTEHRPAPARPGR
jgi:FlaA1/EpsC-like NDP-sugar epimerase